MADHVFRELTSASELVQLLRLRHRIYFEECGYGPPRAHGLDLTVHDARSRLYGLFAGEQLVGGMRLVLRAEQPIAVHVHALRASLGVENAAPAESALPSEEAFDLAPVLGERRHLVDLEIGRLAVLRDRVDSNTVFQVLVAVIGAVICQRAFYYLYSCAADTAAHYARVAKPRWQLDEAQVEGFAKDGFSFPRRTVALVAAPEDSPFFAQAITMARALANQGELVLQASEGALARSARGASRECRT